MATPVVSEPVPDVVGTAIRGLTLPRMGFPFADRRVDVVEEVSLRVAEVQVGRLGRVHHAPPSDRQERVKRLTPGEPNGILEALIGRLHSHLIVQLKVNAVLVQRLERRLHGRELHQVGVGHDAHLLRPEVVEVHADLLRHARTVADV